MTVERFAFNSAGSFIRTRERVLRRTRLVVARKSSSLVV